MLDRILRYTAILLLASLVSSSVAQVPQKHAANPAGRLEEINGAHILHLQGDPYEMGLQQGSLLCDMLRGFASAYLYELAVLERGASHWELLTWVRSLDPQIPDSLRREMQGIADGAGLSYEDVLLLNTLPDLLTWTPGLFPSLPPGNPANGWAQSATSMAFAAWGPATANRELIAGYDLKHPEAEWLSRYLLVIVRHPRRGNAFVSVGLMGMVGVWAGMNEERITATLLGSPSVDVASTGQPPPFMLRQVLEETGDLDHATRIILSAQRLYGGNVLLGDGKAPEAVVIELSAHRHATFEASAQGGVLARTEHYLDPELALTQPYVLPEQARAASAARLDRLLAMLESNAGWIGVDKALAFLDDAHDGHASSGPGLNRPGNGPRSLESVLLCPGSLTLFAAQLDVAESPGRYVRLDLGPSLLGRSQL